jgi:hypothetical protein
MGSVGKLAPGGTGVGKYRYPELWRALSSARLVRVSGLCLPEHKSSLRPRL